MTYVGLVGWSSSADSARGLATSVELARKIFKEEVCAPGSVIAVSPIVVPVIPP